MTARPHSLCMSVCLSSTTNLRSSTTKTFLIHIFFSFCFFFFFFFFSPENPTTSVPT
jgi:hypothetical protein